MRKIIIVSCIVLMIVFFIFYSVSFRKTVQSSDIKKIAENIVGDLFNARVSIDTINVGLLKYISLSGLQVNQRLSDKFFYLVNVKKIVFKYNIFNFFKTDPINPNQISIYAPVLEFNRIEIPQTIVNQKLLEKAHILFEVREGKIAYVIPGIETVFLFSDINGHITPIDAETLSLGFRGKGEGDIMGGVALSGTVNQQTHECDLRLLFDNMSVKSDTFVPVEGLRGSVQVTREDIHIDDITFFVRDVPVRLTGAIVDYNNNPVLDLQFRIHTRNLQSTFTIFDTYEDLKIKGNVRLADYAFTFQGEIDLREGGFTLYNLLVNDEYVGKGDFLINTGEYTFHIEKDNQQIQCNFLHTNYHMKMNLVLNHVTFLGYDFVVVGEIELEPDISFWRDERLILNGSIKTDYMIFNYTPLEDFQGTFTIAPHMLSNINVTWGDVYGATGAISLGEPEWVEGEMNVTDLDLSDCEAIVGYLIPKDISGTINSRITISGPTDNPKIEGYVHSGPGRLRELDFKKAVVNLGGNRHVLTLNDSKIYRGDTVFYLLGNVDFTKKNIFHDIVLESSENIVLWRGWDLTQNVEEDAIFLRRKVTDNLDVNIHGALHPEETDSAPASQGAVSLHYTFEDDPRVGLSFETEEKTDKEHSMEETILE